MPPTDNIRPRSNPKARVSKPKGPRGTAGEVSTFGNGKTTATAKAKVGVASKPAPKKATVRKPSNTVVDAVASVAGPAYKDTQAKPKQGTPAQRKKIRKSYDKLPPAEKKKALKDAKLGTVEGDTILSTHAARVRKRREDSHRVGVSGTANVAKDKTSKSVATINIASKVAGGGLEAAVLGVNAATGSKLPHPDRLVHIAGAATKNIAQATYEDPTAVAGSSGRETANILRGIGAAGLGLARATGDTAAHPTHIKRLPGAVNKFADGVKKDYERRYGDVLDDPKAFRERVKHEGAVSYALDLAPGVGAAGKLTGEIAGKVAKTGALGSAAKAATEARPLLRVGGNEVREQARSNNLYRAVLQDAKDRSRRKALVKRKDAKGRTKGLLPQADNEVVRKTLRAQNRDQRRSVSRVSARAGHRTQRDQGREVHGGKESSAAVTKQLDKHEKLGLKYAIQLGIRDPQTAIRELRLRREAIVKARKEGDKKFEADFDELPIIDEILKDPDKVFTPRLAQAAEKERARGQRTAGIDPNLTEEAATARAHADQAAHLDIVRGGKTIREARKEAARDLGAAKKKLAEETQGGGRSAIQAALKDVEDARKRAADLKAKKQAGHSHVDQEPVADVVARVKAKAAERGLAEPGYFPGRVFDEGGSAPYTGHNVGRAMAKDKQYTGTSFTLGVQDVRPEALQLGLAKNIKRAHNHQGVTDVLDKATPAWGKGPKGNGLTAAEAKQAIRAQGADPASWALVNTGILRKAIDEADVTGDVAGADARIAHALDKNIHTLDGLPAEYKGTAARFHVVPKAVADELVEGMRPTNPALRTVAKVQGVQSKFLLNLNPTFVPVQVVSNTPLAVLAMKGNVLDLLKAQRWYKSLDRQAKDAVDEIIGVSASRSVGQSTRFGDSTGNRLAKTWDSVLNSQRYREWQESIRNPMQWNPMLDDKQNAFFRRAVFYNAAKREAAASMGRAAGGVLDDADVAIRALKLPPGPAKTAALRKAEPQLERIGQHVDEMLGDWTRFTAAERKYLKTSIFFYGFMRWATRLAFYTLPVKHPIATAIAGKLGQLHNEEVVDLLSDYGQQKGVGTKEEVAKLLREGAMPYVFGRVWQMKNGNLEFADATRLNPLMGPLLDSMERMSKQGIAAAPSAGLGLLSPAFANALDATYGKSTFTRKDLVDENGNPLDAEGNLAYLVGQQARTVWPIRVADKLLNPAPQSDDSIPLIRVRRAKSTSANRVAVNAAKRRERGTDVNVLLDEVLAMARTRRDGVERGIAAELDKKRNADRKRGVTVRRPRGGLPTLPSLPSLPRLPSLPTLPSLPSLP